MEKKSGVSESRRNLLKGLAALPFIGSFSIVTSAARILSKDKGYLTEEAKDSLKNLKGVLPKGKLGKYEISRLVIGCNPMGGWSHSRDLSYVGQLSKHWHTDTKMKETWAIAEQAGINFCNLVEFQYKAFNEYKKETGSKMLNVCQCSIGQPTDRLAPVRKAVDDGADSIYIQGENVDGLAKTNAIDVLLKTVEYIHGQGLLAGVGAHSIKSIQDSINVGVKPDFYYKTFHHDKYWSATPRECRKEYPNYSMTPITDHNQWNDNMWDQFSEQTIEVFKSIDVPFFGFKVMAAGAIRPADGIRWAYENGADFVCLGMYDFQVVDDVNTTIDILGSLGKRERPWYA
ncbi:MAG: hypothetical protein NTV31_07265 [Bacteroidia bacterium]|nr:hypothetical protein [Bacteroidia bacterium]